MDNNEKINEELLELQEIWGKEVVNKFYISHEKQHYSIPFYTACPPLHDKRRVLVVGQEAKDYGRLCIRKKWPIEGTQLWNIRFTELQLLNKFNTYNSEENYKVIINKQNKSPFWNFIRIIKKETETDIIWTNLDKIHRYDENCEKMGTLLCEEEIELHESISYKNSNKSLLLHEIDIIKPDIILFLTGPNYIKSMETALKEDLLGNSSLKNKSPEYHKGYSSKIFSEFEVNHIKAIWTYHPNYLYYIEEFENVISKIASIIKNI